LSPSCEKDFKPVPVLKELENGKERCQLKNERERIGEHHLPLVHNQWKEVHKEA